MKSVDIISRFRIIYVTEKQKKKQPIHFYHSCLCYFGSVNVTLSQLAPENRILTKQIQGAATS